jgi:hypothetical protein
MYNAYLLWFKPEGLLALAGYPRAATKDYSTFYHPRFVMGVPQELENLVMPMLPQLEQQVLEMGKEASASRKAYVKTMRYGATVAVQDGLELAEEYPNNPVHRLLMRNPTFW